MAKWKTWAEFQATLSPVENKASEFRYELTKAIEDEKEADDDAIFSDDIDRVIELLYKNGKQLAIVPLKETANV